MIARNHRLSVARQCELLALPRSTFYYQPAGVPGRDLALMRQLDELHLEHPWMGSRSLHDQLRRAGFSFSRDRVRRLMRKMGIHALYRKPRTTIPEQGHKVYPYRLHGLAIDRPNQVWAADITYVPMARGFLYLVAVMDWHSRKVLAWRLSNTLTADFCVEALQEALSHYGPPQIFNTDQGSQFTRSSPTRSERPALKSAWMARDAGWTTSSLSGCGARSNTRRFISRPTRRWHRPESVSARTSISTMPDEPTRHLVD
jgi:putative transposase